MAVLKCLTVSLAYIAQYIILSSNEWIVRILSLDESLLLKEPLNFVNGDLSFHVARDNEYVFLISESPEVQARHGASLDFLVSEHADFLL